MKVFLVHFESESENEVSVVSNSVKPMDCSPPGSSVHGIFQARILEWIAISFSRDWTQVFHAVGRRLYCLSHQEILVHFIITLFNHIQPQSQTSKDLVSVIYISFHFQKVYIYGVR